MTQRLPFGTKVKFDIAQGLCTGTATIGSSDIDVDNGHISYKLEDVILDSNSHSKDIDMHRESKTGELWVNDFEVRPIR